MKIKGCCLFLMIFFAAFGLNAQITTNPPLIATPMKVSINGKVTDRNSGKGILGVSIVAKTRDSVLIGYTISDEKGEYTLEGLPLHQDFYCLVSLHGYKDTIGSIKINSFLEKVRRNWVLETNERMLSEIEIKARKPPLVIKKDTLEFDPEAFKLLPQAMLEDLLRKLPGIIIKQDGSITVNGKNVTKIQVDKRDFFGGSLSIATQNIPAGIIDKVQVMPDRGPEEGYNKMIRPTGENVIMNVQLKKNMNQGVFGNVLAGYGTKDRYEAGGMLNFFKGQYRFGIFGAAGNGNSSQGAVPLTSGLSAGGSSTGTGAGTGSGVVKGGAGAVSNPGLTDNKNAAGNFNTTIGDKTTLDGNYSFNNQSVKKEKQTDRVNFQDAGTSKYNENKSEFKRSNGHALSAVIAYTPDTLSTWRFTPSFNFGPSKSEEKVKAFSVGQQPEQMNTSESINYKDASQAGFGHQLSMGKKSKDGKSGFTLNWSVNVQQSTADLSNRSENHFFGGIETIIDQNSHEKGNIWSNNATMQFSRTLGSGFVAALEYSFNQQFNHNRKDVFNFNPASKQYDSRDSLLSTDNSNSIIDQVPSFQIAYREDKLDVALNAGMRFLNQKNKLLNKNEETLYNQMQFTPRLLLNYRFDNSANLNVSFDIASTPPTPQQLSPVNDVSNPLVVLIGNPSLKTSLGHNINASFGKYIPSKEINFNISGGANFTKNKIIQDVNYDNQGRQLISYRNADGAKSFQLSGGFQVGYHIKELSIQPSLNFSVDHKNEIGFITSVLNETKAWTYGANAGLSIFYREFLSVSPFASLTFNKTKYNENTRNNIDYNVQNYGLRMTVSPVKRFEVESQFSYQYNSQIPAEFQRNAKLWNGSMSYRFLSRQQLRFKFSVNDILNDGVATATTVTPSFLENTMVNTLRRYFMFTLQYNFNGLSAGMPVEQLK